MSLLSFFTPKTLEATCSTVNGRIKVIESFGRRTLYVEGIEQSGGTIVPMWEEAFSKVRNSMPFARQAKFETRNCLILGIGGGTVIKIIKAKWPQVKITGIEIDPVIVEIAKKYFNLEKYSDLKIVIEDATSWIMERSGNCFDLVVVDIFVGKFNPKVVRKTSFLSNLKKIIGKSGFIFYNSHFQEEKAGEFAEFMGRCKKVFTKAEVIVKYRYSYILFLK